jgi:hypothetical protein
VQHAYVTPALYKPKARGGRFLAPIPNYVFLASFIHQQIAYSIQHIVYGFGPPQKLIKTTKKKVFETSVIEELLKGYM